MRHENEETREEKLRSLGIGGVKSTWAEVWAGQGLDWGSGYQNGCEPAVDSGGQQIAGCGASKGWRNGTYGMGRSTWHAEAQDTMAARFCEEVTRAEEV